MLSSSKSRESDATDFFWSGKKSLIKCWQKQPQEVSVRKGVLSNLAKFAGKHLFKEHLWWLLLCWYVTESLQIIEYKERTCSSKQVLTEALAKLGEIMPSSLKKIASVKSEPLIIILATTRLFQKWLTIKFQIQMMTFVLY